MIELLGSLIGAGGGIASSIMGAKAANQADSTNWAINLMNYYQRERERRDRIRQADKVDRETKLGQTDADGGTVKFVPGVGWVTKRGDKQEVIANLQNQEQRNILEKDLPTKRAVMNRNVQRGLEDSADADALRREMKSLRKNDDADLEALLYNSATANIDDSFDKAIGTAARENARTGSSNINQTIAELAKEAAKTKANAAMEAKLRARGQGQQEYDTRRAGLANLFNMFATRASVGPDVSFQPMPVDINGQKVAAQYGKQGLQSGAELSNAFGQKGGSMDYVQPNYGNANAAASIGNALAGLSRSVGASMVGMGGMEGGTSSKAKTQYRSGENDW